jgi:hypothetical protein
MAPTGYRLHMSVFARIRRIAVYLVLGALFVPGLVDPASSLVLRLGCLLGVGLAGFGLRVVLGSAVVVRAEGLRIYTWWPRHRDIAWYRIFAVEVIPGRWVLDLELNFGGHVTLPPVERVDELYEQIEDLRERLDV